MSLSKIPVRLVLLIWAIGAVSCAISEEPTTDPGLTTDTAEYDSDTDTDTSSLIDSESGSESQDDDTQTGTQSEIDTDPAEYGLSCETPIELAPESQKLTFTDSWIHYPDDTFDGSMSGCLENEGNAIWFKVDVPSAWKINVNRIGGAQVSINFLPQCDAGYCFRSAYGQVSWRNDTGNDMPIYVAVEGVSYVPEATINLEIELIDESGNICEEAILWNGQEQTFSLDDFENSEMPLDCRGTLVPYGPNLWLRITVPAAHQLDFTTNDPADTTVGYSLDCIRCGHFYDEPESFTYKNPDHASVNLYTFVHAVTDSVANSQVTVLATISPLPEGDACDGAIDLDETALDTYVWQGGTQTLMHTCTADICPGTFGPDIWHEITIPSGQVLEVNKSAGPGAFMAVIDECPDTQALAFTTNTDKLIWENTGQERTVKVVTGTMISTDISSLEIRFSLFDATAGDLCSSAHIVPNQATWDHTGQWSSMDDYFTAGLDCEVAVGSDVWFSVNLDPLKFLKVADKGANDLVFNVLDSCGVDSCIANGSTAKDAFFFNPDSTAKQLFVVVESKTSSPSTSGWDVNFIQTSPPNGDLCSDPILIDASSPTTWQEHTWDHFFDAATLDPALGCGSALGRDAWFQVNVPGKNKLVITENTISNPTNINIIEGCADADKCLYYENDKAVWFNTSDVAAQVLVSVEEINPSVAATELTLSFTSTPIMEGDACTNPITSIPPLENEAVDLSTFETSLPWGVCSEATGPDVWYLITVPAGQVLSLKEKSSVEATMYLTTGCPASDCFANSVDPDELFWHNNTGQDVSTFAVVRADFAADKTETLLIDMNVASATEGDFCANPIDLTSVDLTAGHNESGDLDGFTNGFNGQGSNECANTSGNDLWYKFQVPAGKWLHVENTTQDQVGIQIKTDCASDTCNASGIRSAIWHNDSADTQDVFVSIDKVDVGSVMFDLIISTADDPPGKFGPDTYGYWGAADIDLSKCADISTTGTVIENMGDESIEQIQMDQSFDFYGVSYDSLYVATNGFITFTNAHCVAPSATNSQLPVGNFDATYAGKIIPAILVAWQDIASTISDPDRNIYYKNFSQNGHDYFQVQYQVVPFSGPPTGSWDFSILLDATTNNIHLCYPNTQLGIPASDNGAAATVGIQASDENFLQFSDKEAVLNSGLHIWMTNQ